MLKGSAKSRGRSYRTGDVLQTRLSWASAQKTITLSVTTVAGRIEKRRTGFRDDEVGAIFPGKSNRVKAHSRVMEAGNFV